MPWTSLEIRGVDSLPLILAGPILRRVESDSVSVWLALKEAKNIKLVVKNFDGTEIFSSNFNDAYVSISTNLHITCLTAKPKVGQSKLSPGAVYFYDIVFDNQSILDYDNLGGQPLSYSQSTEALPSFVLSPGNLMKLRLVQGS